MPHFIQAVPTSRAATFFGGVGGFEFRFFEMLIEFRFREYEKTEANTSITPQLKIYAKLVG